MLEHYVARLKYPLTLGHEDVCLFESDLDFF